MQEVKLVYLVYIGHPTKDKHKTIGHFDAVNEDDAIAQARHHHPKIFEKYERQKGGFVATEAQGYAN